MKIVSRNRHLPSILIKGIGLVIMAVILSRVDYEKMYAIFSGIRPLYLAAALAILLPTQLIKAFRWNMLLRDGGIHYPFGRTFVMFWIGVFFGTLTPAKAGDLVKLVYLKADRKPLEDGLPSIILDRLGDLCTVCVVGVLASLAFLPLGAGLKIGACIAIGGGAVYLLLFTNLASKLGARLLSGGLTPRIGIGLHELRTRLSAAARRLWAPVALLSLASWAAAFLTTYCIGRALGLSISYLQVCGVISISSLIALIPVTISGIGTRDTAIIVLFGSLGLPREAAVAFSLLVLLSIIVNSAVGFLLYLWHPLPLPSLGDMRKKVLQYLSSEEKHSIKKPLV